MPKLYTMPGTCSLACNIAVAWTDAPIEIVNMPYGDHKKDAYLAINPKGKVPALQLDDGRVLTELPAIMSWIAAEHGGTEFMPQTPWAWAQFDDALSYMTSEVHADFKPHFAAEGYAESDAAQGEVKEAAYDRLRTHFGRLNDTLSDAGDYYLGEKSLVDAFLYVLCRWTEKTPIKLKSFPALLLHTEEMERDEGVETALERQDMKPFC